MKKNPRDVLCQACLTVLSAGIMILLIGLYYQIVKAGLPYQDPPLELQIQYAVNMGIGDLLVGKGFLIALLGGGARLLIGLLWKKG